VTKGEGIVTAEAWKRNVGSRAALIVAMLVAVALLIPTAARADAPADSGVVERTPSLSAWVISGDGLIVLTGPPLVEGCFGEGFLTPIATVVNTPSGATLTKVTHSDQVWVFDDEGFTNPLDWLFGRACPAVWAGQPAPDPLAQGEGLVRVNSRVDADGVEHGNVRVTAMVTTADGEDVHLNTHGTVGVIGGDFINYGG